MTPVRTISKNALLAGVAAAFVLGSNNDLSGAAAFSVSPSAARTTPANNPLSLQMKPVSSSSSSSSSEPENSDSGHENGPGKAATTLAASLAFALATASTTLPVPPANAYIPSDYASDTVQTAIQDLKSASGNSDETFKVYEGIAGIITEGKGVGGQINYSKYSTRKQECEGNERGHETTDRGNRALVRILCKPVGFDSGCSWR